MAGSQPVRIAATSLSNDTGAHNKMEHQGDFADRISRLIAARITMGYELRLIEEVYICRRNVLQ